MYFKDSLNYEKLVTNLVSIISRVWKIFESSKIDRKRQLIGMLTSNLEVDDKKLYVELKSPFDMIYELDKSKEWGSIVDLFRTKIMETELHSLVDSIKLIFEKFDIELAT